MNIGNGGQNWKTQRWKRVVAGQHPDVFMPYSSGKLVFQIIVGMKFNVFYARVVQSGVSIAGTGSAKECCCSMVTRSVNISVWGALLMEGERRG